MLRPGYTFAGESGRVYRLISPLGVPKKASAQNIWKAVNDSDDSEQFMIKEPSSDDDATLNWPAFQHELEMQKLFKDSALIRPMVDFVPSSASIPPRMVLQGFEKTLWTARNRRQLTSDEIKWIMQAVILALGTVHRKGYVYSGASSFAVARLCTNLLQI
jgi:male germ cell-associated kinase